MGPIIILHKVLFWIWFRDFYFTKTNSSTFSLDSFLSMLIYSQGGFSSIALGLQENMRKLRTHAQFSFLLEVCEKKV
jgi:hypothetical protein